MQNGASVPLRILCAVMAVLCGFVALRIAVTGEMLTKQQTAVELTLGMRCILVGVLGLLSVLAGWVAVTGRQ